MAIAFIRWAVQKKFFGDILDRARTAAPTHIPGKAFGVERIVGKKVQLLPLHLAAAPAENSSNLEFQIDPHVARWQIANASRGSVVPTHGGSATFLADCFFERRNSVMGRALGSPKMPRTVSCGLKPANRYASCRRLRLGNLAMAKSCQFPHRCQTAKTRFQ